MYAGVTFAEHQSLGTRTARSKRFINKQETQQFTQFIIKFLGNYCHFDGRQPESVQFTGSNLRVTRNAADPNKLVV